MEKGDRLVSKTATDKYAFPKFIWDIYKSVDSEKVIFIINDLKGKDIAGVKEKLKDYSGVLPNHAKFRLVDKKELLKDFIIVTANGELRSKFSGGRKFSPSKSPTSCSCKTLPTSIIIEQVINEKN